MQANDPAAASCVENKQYGSNAGSKDWEMRKGSLSVSLPPEMRSLIEKEAKAARRSRSAIVSDALQLYFQLRRIGTEVSTDEERGAIAEGKRAYEQGEFVPLDEWRHALGLGDH
jgi:predicted transcriptional regulator